MRSISDIVSDISDCSTIMGEVLKSEIKSNVYDKSIFLRDFGVLHILHILKFERLKVTQHFKARLYIRNDNKE